MLSSRGTNALASATGWFDMAFTENILESLDFDYGHSERSQNLDQKVTWKCIDGGTEVLTETLRDDLNDEEE